MINDDSNYDFYECEVWMYGAVGWWCDSTMHTHKLTSTSYWKRQALTSDSIYIHLLFYKRQLIF